MSTDPANAHPDTGPPEPTGSGRAAARMTWLVVLNWSRFGVMLVLGLLIVPMMIGPFGVAMWGLFMLVALCRFPFQETIQPLLTRELASAWSTGDEQTKRRAWSTGVAVSLLSAAVCAAIVAAALPMGMRFLSIPDGRRDDVFWLILLEGVTLVMMIAAGPWWNMTLATHRLVESNIHRLLERGQDLIALVAALYLLPINPDQRFIAFLGGRLVLRMVHIAVCWLRVRAQEPLARTDWSLVDRGMMRHYSAAVGWSTSIPISNQFFYMVDHVLFNLFFGALFNGIYQITQQLRAYSRILGGGISVGAEGITADLHGQGRHEATKKLLLASMKLSSVLTCVCTALIAVFAGALMQSWLGKQLAADQGLAAAGVSVDQAVALCWTFFLIMVPSILVSEAGGAALPILYGMGHLKKFAPALLISTVAKLVLTWVVISSTTGGFDTRHVLLAAWVTLGVSVLMYAVYLPVVIKRASGLRIRDQMVQVYLKPLLSTVPIVGLGLLAARVLGPWHPGLVSMAKLGAVCGLLGILFLPIAAVIVPEGQERQRVGGIIARLLRKLPGLRALEPTARRVWNVGV